MKEQSDKAKLLQEAKERFKKAYDNEKEQKDLYIEDMEFIGGDQWDPMIKRDREQSQRPCLTINRVAAFVQQVIADARQNSPSIQVHPVDNQSDPVIAEIMEGLIRQIEYQSNADQAYDTGLETAASGGLGAIRVVTKYAGDDTFNQDIAIKRVLNPLSIYWDPAAKEYDKSDAMWCFVTESLPDEEFERRYGDADDVGEWKGDDSSNELWADGESKRIAEYWVKEECSKDIALLETGVTVDLSGFTVHKSDGVEYVEAGESVVRIIKRRTAITHKVVRYVLTSDKVLSGPEEWAGKHIPVVPVYGPEHHIDGKTEYRSVIRHAKDPARQYNYWQSTITEKVALSPKSPFLVTPTQIDGFEGFWKNANSANYSFLPYNPDEKAPPPQRQSPAAINGQEIQQAAQAIDDMKAVTGMHDPSLGSPGSDISERAFMARQMKGDSATFAWHDNLARSIRQVGRILVDLIPKIYDTQRVIRVIGRDGAEKFAEINKAGLGPNGESMMFNDITAGKYDVTISTGPSYQTQRLAAADSLIQFVTAVPQAGAVAMDLIAKNMDWPGADELSRRLKMILPPGILPPDDPDARMPAPPPPPDLWSQAKMIEAQTRAIKTQAEVDKLEAQTQGQLLENAEKAAEQTGELQSIIRGAVISALAEMQQRPIM